VPGVVTAAVAVGVGAIASAAAAKILGFVRRTEAGEREAQGSFVGCAGRVTLPIGDGRAGRVVVQRGAREVELRARPFADRDVAPPVGAEVVVVEMEDGTAYVTTLEEPLLAPGPQD